LSKEKWGKRRKDGQAYPKGPVPVKGGSYDIQSAPTQRAYKVIEIRDIMVESDGPAIEDIEVQYVVLDNDGKEHLVSVESNDYLETYKVECDTMLVPEDLKEKLLSQVINAASVAEAEYEDEFNYDTFESESGYTLQDHVTWQLTM